MIARRIRNIFKQSNKLRPGKRALFPPENPPETLVVFQNMAAQKRARAKTAVRRPEKSAHILSYYVPGPGAVEKRGFRAKKRSVGVAGKLGNGRALVWAGVACATAVFHYRGNFRRKSFVLCWFISGYLSIVFGGKSRFFGVEVSPCPYEKKIGFL